MIHLQKNSQSESISIEREFAFEFVDLASDGFSFPFKWEGLTVFSGVGFDLNKNGAQLQVYSVY